MKGGKARSVAAVVLLGFVLIGTAFAPVLQAQSADGEIVVTGSRRAQKRKDSAVAVEVIGREQIEKEGSRNAADALTSLPGVEVRPGQPGQRGEIVRLQGLDTRQVLILVNGNRITGRFDGGIDLTRIKAEEIERIEIIKGATSALYGSDAIGGVINIITREPTKPLEAQTSAQWGSGRELHYGSGSEADVSSRVSFKNEALASSFYAGWHRSDGWDLTPDASPGARSDRIDSQSDVYDPTRKNLSRGAKLAAVALERDEEIEDEPLESSTGNAYRDLSVGNNTTFYLSERTKLRTDVNYRYLDQDGTDSTPPRATYDRRSRTHDYQLGIGPDIEFGKGNFSARYSYARFLDVFTVDQRETDEGDRKDVTDDRVSELRLQLDYQVHPDHFVTAGADGMIEELSSPRIGLDCQLNFPDECIHEELDLPPDRDSGEARRKRAAFFIQDEWIMFDDPRVFLVPGLRFEDDDHFGGETAPRLALRVDPDERWKIRVGTGRGFRAPSFKELYFSFQNPGAGYQVVGNEDLEPERSWSSNASVEYSPGDRFWLSFGVFHNEIENLIEFRRQPGANEDGLATFQTVNFERALTQGVETAVSFNWKPGAHRFGLDLGYTYTNARDLQRDLPLEGRSIHSGNFRLSYEYKPGGFGLRLFGSVFGKQPYYCEKSPLWCVDPDEYETYLDEEYIFDRTEDYLKEILELDENTIALCDYYELVVCSSEVDNGFTMENPYNLVNFRVYKKWNNLEFFAGVNNMLDAYHIEHNLIQPRFYYVGLTATIDGTPLETDAPFRKDEGFRDFKNSDSYRRLRERQLKEERREFERYRQNRNAPSSQPPAAPGTTTPGGGEDEVEIIE